MKKELRGGTQREEGNFRSTLTPKTGVYGPGTEKGGERDIKGYREGEGVSKGNNWV